MSAPFSLPYRTAPDTLDAIRSDLVGLLTEVSSQFETKLAQVEPVSEPATASAARALYLRRALEQAADLGAAMLDALGEPQLDALDAAIVALDALDADPDLEPWLAGAPTSAAFLDLEAEDLDEDDGTGEPTLASPERHPFVLSLGSPYYDPANGVRLRRIRSCANQATWAQGSREDGEGEPEAGCDLREGDGELDDDGLSQGERDESEREPELGSPIGDGNQERWAQGLDCEAVNEDGGGRSEPASRPIGPGPRPDSNGSCLFAERRAIRRRAEDVRRRVKGSEPRRDPDLVILAGMPCGTALWRPHFTRDGVPVVGVASQ